MGPTKKTKPGGLGDQLSLLQPRLTRSPKGVTLHLPGIRLVSEANARDHWAVKDRRRKSQQTYVTAALRTVLRRALTVDDGDRLRVVITRIAPKPLDVFDNLPRSCKAVVDAIARWLGIDDADPRVKYEAENRKGAPKEYGVEVRFEYVREGA